MPSSRAVVLDPAPVYRRGLVEALRDGGHEVVVPEDLASPDGWASADVVVVTCRPDVGWDTVAALADRPSDNTPRVVVLLEDESAPNVVRALQLGAVSVLSRDVDPRRLLAAIEATAHGDVVVSRISGHALASAAVAEGEPDWLTRDEVEWLRLLADGAKVNAIARAAGYSERQMFRLLFGLYGRMGVASRDQAVLTAQRWGVLEPVG